MYVYGIADAHGIESMNLFEPNPNTDSFEMDPRTASLMILRARANAHRHAVVYQAELSLKSMQEIQDLLDAGEYPEALLKLKAEADDIKIAKTPGSEKSWRLIPNPDLDPFS